MRAVASPARRSLDTSFGCGTSGRGIAGSRLSDHRQQRAVRCGQRRLLPPFGPVSHSLHREAVRLVSGAVAAASLDRNRVLLPRDAWRRGWAVEASQVGGLVSAWAREGSLCGSSKTSTVCVSDLRDSHFQLNYCPFMYPLGGLLRDSATFSDHGIGFALFVLSSKGFLLEWGEDRNEIGRQR